AGKSLVGLKEGAARYRMSDPRVMPRFGSGRNPFRQRTVEAGPAGDTASAQPILKGVEKAKPSGGLQDGRRAASKPATTSSPRQAQAAESWLKRRLGNAGKKLRGMFPRRETPKPLKQTRPLSGPVQGELSLDTVRVVRNDLSDSDYEVVAKKA